MAVENSKSKLNVDMVKNLLLQDTKFYCKKVEEKALVIIRNTAPAESNAMRVKETGILREIVRKQNKTCQNTRA